MDYQEHEISGEGGRTIAVATFGDPAGTTVVFHHGSPGSSNQARYFEGFAESGGLFVVGFSRPGYGTSSRRAGRSVASVVADVDDVLDALGREDYLSVGWSGGGPHSLACAVLGAPRCRAAWSLAGVVPVDVDLDWTAGMGPENLEEFALAAEGGPRYEEAMVEAGREFGAASADNVVALFGGLLSDVDKAALEDLASRELLASSMVPGFTRGHWGFYDDDRAFLSPWGFDVASIGVPVSIWYGDQDLMVPPTHGAWLGSHVPGCTVVHRHDEGDISLVTSHLDELANELVSAARA
jgi:pimeloyl-ACP methyl ester carboxylesterase